jgi:eukaryotic-like serine/threonine-protein kinase
MSGIPAGAGSLLGKRLGKYEILALLALGGTAEIYLARIGGAAGFEKYVVVKCLHDHLADDQDFVKMFLDEARLAAYLDHSNIVQTMELGEHEGRYYMVMEFLAGLSMAMMVRRAGERLPGGRIPVPLVLNMMAQACAGLHYAHERATSGKPLNIVHRDISPQNLVISFEGVVKVVDFGIAKAEMRETQTRSGTIKGKFAYMSPEQCVANKVDRRTDVFALGIIAHEMLTGRRLFKKPSPYETYQAVMECNVAAPSALNVEIDPALDPIIMKALAKDREQRYPTAEAFGDALQGYLHHRGKGSGPNEVGRFFEASFLQEIEEHGARMRELINGRDPSIDTGVSWGAEEEEAAAALAASKRRDETVDLGRSKRDDSQSISLSTSDLELVNRSSASVLNEVISNLQDPDSMPADRTRIESNPLEDEPPRPPQRPVMPPSGALPLPPAPAGPPQMASMPRIPSGRFPDLANLPTMVADLEDTPKPVVEQARTEIAIQPIGSDRVTSQAPAIPGPPPQRNGTPKPADPQRIGLAPTSPPPFAPPAASPPMPQPPMGPRSTSPPPMVARQPIQQRPQPNASAPPIGYPVMSSSQIDPATNRPYPESGAFIADPQRAANMMSPVGQQYPQMDWNAAAAMPARALPKWLLGVLFVGAIGLALTITIVFARLIR